MAAFFENFHGSFTLENVLPALTRVQNRKTARILDTGIISHFRYLLNHDRDNLISGFNIYGGYTSDENNRFSHYHRTRLSYNTSVKKGLIIREDATPIQSKYNPYFTITIERFSVEIFNLIQSELYPIQEYQRKEAHTGQIILFSVMQKEDSFSEIIKSQIKKRLKL